MRLRIGREWFEGATDRAREVINRGDADGFVLICPNTYAMRLVADNADLLIERGIYERALVVAFSATRTNNADTSVVEIEGLLARADRAKLQSAGDPIPDGERFRLFRGVAGHGRARRVRGYSWTDSLSVAAWFAMRLAADLPDPAVVQTVAKRSDVLWFDDGRSEREFVIRPSRARRVELSAGELRTLAQESTDRIRAANMASVAAHQSKGR